MLRSFQNHIDHNLAFITKGKLLVAISGGLDSVVLTHLCHKLKLNISLAHCNFNLRNEESDADEDFVLQLAEDLDLEVFIESFDTEDYAKNNKLSTQMAARELRYQWFEDLATQLQFDYILTAHHADDNLETFLINLSRGTGLDGLIGIPEINGNIVRPLLKFSREDIETYATANKLKWQEDSSNASTKYLRNKLRHEVIPVLKEINPQILQNVEITQVHLQEISEIVDDTLAEVQKKVVSIEGEIIKFNIKKLLQLSHPKAYLYQLIKSFDFPEINDVYNLITAQSGKHVFSATHRLLKDREFLLLSELTSDISLNQDINYNDKQIQCSLGHLTFEEVEAIGEVSKSVIYVDKDTLEFPLTLRSWQEGDVFFPIGMKGKKKVGKYFKDEKLSLIEKEQSQLLCSGTKIIWIVGRRADNRFKVTESTQHILKIQLQ
ncbi:tRNA lysidine(34) synthetase TilS [Geojedonia litorea]|uniref:tRNA(Ile)-lysidine synthase n=1 Tax=Geojedonia litorea TaxID=1268269 RepID=A0ABV9N394_9FLAO